jgi:ketosteroid isomerase-like protein
MAAAAERQQRNVERVRDAFDAFNRGDVGGVLAVLADDVEIFSAPPLANAGTFHGHDGYARWVGQWLEAWEEFRIGVQRIEPVGGRHVVVGVRQTGRGRGSGIPVEMTAAYMFELDEEAAKALHLYPSWDEAVAVAEQRERETPE